MTTTSYSVISKWDNIITSSTTTHISLYI